MARCHRASRRPARLRGGGPPQRSARSPRSDGGLRSGWNRRARRPCPVAYPLGWIASPSVRQQRHRLSLIAPEQHRSRDGGGAEAVADAVERLIDRVATLEGEDELDV